MKNKLIIRNAIRMLFFLIYICIYWGGIKKYDIFSNNTPIK